MGAFSWDTLMNEGQDQATNVITDEEEKPIAKSKYSWETLMNEGEDVTPSNIETTTRVNPYSSTSKRRGQPNPYSSTLTRKKFSEAIDYGGNLSKDDLKSGKNVMTVRDYMVARHGARFKVGRANTISDDEVVEEFVQHMRWFTSNMIWTGGELIWMTKEASEEDKIAAKNAYELYEQLGNVFTTGGFGDKAGGIWDYVRAGASDPSNLLGLFTGGIARAGTFAGQTVAKKQLRRAAVRAGKDALLSGKGKKEVSKAVLAAKRRMAGKLTDDFAKSDAGKDLIEQAAVNAATYQGRVIRETGKSQFVSKEVAKSVKRSILYTAGLDGAVSVAQDAAFQATLMSAEAQKEYNAIEGVLSFGLGAIGAGGQYGFQKITNKLSGFENAKLKNKLRRLDSAMTPPMLNLNWKNKTQADVVIAKNVTESVTAWAAKWDAIKKLTPAEVKAKKIKRDVTTINNDLLNYILRGPNGDDSIGGLVRAYNIHTNGARLHGKTRVNEVLAHMIQYIPNKELRAIGIQIEKIQPGTDLVDFLDPRLMRDTLEDTIKGTASLGGQLLAQFSHAKTAMNAGLTASEMAMKAQIRSIDANAITAWEPSLTYKIGNRVEHKNKLYTAKKNHVSGGSFKPAEWAEMKAVPEAVGYAINLWRRLVVSLPETTVMNIKGFASIYTGNTAAELLSGAQYFAAAALTTDKKRQKEMMRMGRIHFAIQGKKFQTFMKPYDSYETFKAILEENPEAKKVLMRTLNMGIAKQGDRFGINPSNKMFQAAETLADAANMYSGVKLQDIWTKSQFFLPELDKYTRIKYNKTLDEFMEAGQMIDGEALASTIRTTQDSVYSRDFTTEATRGPLRKMAQTIEGLSNTVLFPIMPFGRFFNAVIATAHNWGPTGFVDTGVLRVLRGRELSKTGSKMSKIEETTWIADFNKAAVGVGAITAFTHYAMTKPEGVGTFEVEQPGGSIVDKSNVYPISLLMAMGEALSQRIKKGSITEEAQQDVLKTLGVGQSNTNLQFGNDLNAIATMMFGETTGSEGQNRDQFYKLLGNTVAGVTRPLGAINEIVGYINGTDSAKDARRAEGKGEVLAQSAGRYTNHILQAIVDKLDDVLEDDTSEAITNALMGKELVTARRSKGNVRTSGNVFSKVLGVKVKQRQTSAEELYSVLNMHDWSIDQRSNIPSLDAVFNRIMGPLLERKSDDLLNSKEFMLMPLSRKREIFKLKLKELRKEVAAELEIESRSDSDTYMLLQEKQFKSRYSKAVRKEAIDYMKREGYTTELRDMSPDEFVKISKYAELIKEDIEINGSKY
tara:strand:- start:173 stop:4060 length:3888 start_codon:yes stop_codon:yes gene_type:complete